MCVGEEVSGAIAGGDQGILVLDKTPFYAEMGGQIADHGVIRKGEAVFEVTNVLKDKGGKYLHYGTLHAGKMTDGEIKVGDEVSAEIDVDRRQAIRRAHSATHLLQSALERVLGDHCHQAGSLVEPDRLRFDFTHFSAITPEEMKKINETLVLPIEEAQKLGAKALFGEKYGDTVRVVKMGDASIEFCGGTHLDNTAKVGLFSIVSEGSIASGVRRIEAITGKAVLAQMNGFADTPKRACEIVKAPNAGELLHKAEATVAEVKELRQQLDAMKDKVLSGDVSGLLADSRRVGELNVLTAVRRDLSVADLRKLGDLIRDRDPSAVAVLADIQGEKISILAVCGKQAVASGVKAGNLVKQVCAICGGSGGGKPDSAMGGAKDASKLAEALAEVENIVRG